MCWSTGQTEAQREESEVEREGPVDDWGSSSNDKAAAGRWACQVATDNQRRRFGGCAPLSPFLEALKPASPPAVRGGAKAERVDRAGAGRVGLAASSAAAWRLLVRGS